MTATQSRHYWRNLGLATGAALLLGACVVSIGLVVMLINAASGPLHPARIAIDETPHDYGITHYDDVEFTASDGITLRGWYVPSQNGAAIIMAHGYAWNRTVLLPEAELLAASGYGILLFDFRGHGASDDATVTIGDHERRDLTAAIDFVIAQPGVDPGRIGAIGISMGAATLTQVAAEDKRLSAVVIEAPFATLEDVITDGFHVPGIIRRSISRWIAWREKVDINDVRPVDDLCNISPRPVLLIYGDQDDVVPPGSQEAMFAAACDTTETWLIAGAGHGEFMEFIPEEYAARLVAFFEQTLTNTPPG